MKYKSKLRRNSKYNPKGERFRNHKVFSSSEYIQTCENKIAFSSINKARQARKGLGNSMNVYRCPNCGKFHLTTS